MTRLGLARWHQRCGDIDSARHGPTRRDPTRQDSGRNSKAALNSGGFEMVSSSTRASSASNGNGGEPYGRTTLDRIRRKKNDGPAVVHISLQDSGGDTEMSDLRI